MKLFIIAVLFLLTLTLLDASQYHRTQLNQQWTVTLLGGPTQSDSFKGKSYETSVPTNVHLDLEKAGVISNPLLENNYPKVKWVSECNFSYSTNFTISNDNLKYPLHKLTFEGIDTHSEVFLNDKLILTTANAFRRYSTYVQGILRQGTNTLEVTISSPKTVDEPAQSRNPMPFDYAHTRKACYQYSWDWAPYLNSMGIWKPVYLESFNQLKIDYVWARTRSITKSKAIVNFAIAVEIPHSEVYGKYDFSILQNGKVVATVPLREQYTYYDLHVENPKLWWPNGIGEPYVYDFNVQLIKQGTKEVLDERKFPFGIRTVDLNLADKKMEVKINGYNVYCKGSNWVPPDMFYPRLENPAYKAANTIESLIEDAVASNYNMIRVWGGGQYESDKFLELASRKGIMLFYDFMFSDSIYPSTEEFLTNVEEQIKQQIRRARNYPALTLWSGNNQILQGIQDWGWSSPKYKDDYHKLFEVLIPKIIEYESPYIPYIPSSPVYGVGNYGLDRGGDVHYWTVWAGQAPFDSYQKNVGNFNSQFGTQALPVWQTITEAITKQPSYQDGTLLLHQRHNSQFNTLTNYMRNYMKQSLNFELETYQSGLLQAFAIELAVKAQRAAKPKSAGTLVWQMNDAWPAISWSSIDYYGRWKPLQFMLKRLYPDVAIFCVKDNIYAVNDELYEVKALAIIEFFTLRGDQITRVEKEVTLSPNEVKVIYQVTNQDYKDNNKVDCMIYTEIVAGKNQEMSSTHFNVNFKDLTLYPVQIQVAYHNDFNTLVIETKSTVVKNLFISRKSKYLKTSDNYFDLVPGHPVKVTILGQDNLADIKEDLVFRSYRDVYTQDSQVKVLNP